MSTNLSTVSFDEVFKGLQLVQANIRKHTEIINGLKIV